MDLATCECGCGGTFKPFDYKGRPRKWLKGHQKRQNPLRDLKFIIAVSEEERTKLYAMAHEENTSIAKLIRRRVGFAD